jgi:integrase/recombinase XerD
MGKLREKMLADLEIRNYSLKTRTEYLRCITHFLEHCGCSAEQIGKKEIQAFLLYLIRGRKVSPSVQKMYIASIKFLYRITLNRPDEVQGIPYPKIPKALPDVLSHDEVRAILQALHSLQYKAIISTVYATGMRISEVCRLRCSGDIDSARMVIHIRHGKGAKDRYVTLSPNLLSLLRKYYKETRPQGPYLFPGQKTGHHISPWSVRDALAEAVKSIGLPKHVTLHTLRHCFATHMLEAGENLAVIQALLGHCSIRTTSRYLRVSSQLIARATSPLDLIDLSQSPNCR